MTIADLIGKIKTGVLNPLISMLFVLATVVFMWGVIKYVIGTQGDEKSLESGKRVMLYGIIGMFIMSASWGIVKLLCQFFSVSCAT